jgi:hypothetical protein
LPEFTHSLAHFLAGFALMLKLITSLKNILENLPDELSPPLSLDRTPLPNISDSADSIVVLALAFPPTEEDNPYPFVSTQELDLTEGWGRVRRDYLDEGCA